MRAVEWICKQLDRLLMVFVSLLAAVCLLYSCYVLFDILYNNNKAYVSNDLLQYRPKADEAGEVSMEELKAINEDVVGWITIPGTNIDYPVVQGADDLHYSSHDVYGNGSLTGSIYMAAGSSPELEDYYTIIYGHHMFNGSMFGNLPKYEKEEYYQDHKLIQFDTMTEEGTYEIFAALYSKDYDRNETGVFKYYNYKTLNSEIVFNEFIYNAKQESIYDTGITPMFGDEILTLSTCNYHTEDGRFVVMARKIKNNSYNGGLQ